MCSPNRCHAELKAKLLEHGCWIIKAINVGVPPAAGSEPCKYLRTLLDYNFDFNVRHVGAVCCAAYALQEKEDKRAKRKELDPRDVFIDFMQGEASAIPGVPQSNAQGAQTDV